MSNILLVAATEFEIAPTLAQKENLRVNVLITGVGQLATAYHLGIALRQKKYDWVINAGIAGSFRRDWQLGKVVEIKSEQYGDLGIEEADGSFRDMFEMGFLAKNDFPYQSGVMINDSHTLGWGFLTSAKGLTVNKVHGFAPNIETIRNKYDVEVESMESAAFFYVCKQAQQRFVALRSISNYVESRNRAAWDIPLAIQTLNSNLEKVIQFFHRSQS